MLDYTHIQGIQISSELLMYGAVVIAIHKPDRHPLITVLTIADGGASDKRDYQISNKQFNNLTTSITEILHNMHLLGRSEEENGSLTCNVFIQDKDGNVENYNCPESLDVDTYKKLLTIVNDSINCFAIEDYLGWI